ncbi:hypothetical protein [Opitutus sp. ER46]|uniref:hypothetical protein n=1 Tax=Opitutus sp. ER46 TaxID=2161864 RepID=UPI000D314781|nr:hypothetical protein [Opitutus sp. ER46]PTX96460.1 hypothetical protein DB354_07300 [Opitutus sp. ER46]
MKVFLLSPAKVDGVRAGLLLNPRAPFPLARTLHREGITLAEAFTFASGLYFRGKITYARRFARGDLGDVIRVITTNQGLADPELRVSPHDLRAFGEVDISAGDPRYRKPLLRDLRRLARQLGTDGTAVLLGSIATPKYRDVLLEGLGNRLLFPGDFVGRGDMSRGALLLRAAVSGTELPYMAVSNAVLSTARPRWREAGGGEG